MSLLTNQPNLGVALIAVIVILGLATGGYGWLNWRRPSPGVQKVGQRLRFLWLMTAVFILALLYTRNLLILFLAFIAFLAFKEFLSITPTRRADRRVLFWAYLAIPLQFYFIWVDWYPAFIGFIPVYIFLFLPLLMVMMSETQGFLRAIGTLTWGIITIVFSLGHLAYLLLLPAGEQANAEGFSLFLYLVILTQLNDVAQFVFGKIFNYRQISLKVSTTRTWASLIGGMIVTALLAWLVGPLLTPLSAIEAIVTGLLIALSGFIGYITLAALKSELHFKDRGTMTPGRGGVLNRIDSLLYAAPLFFHLIVYWHYR